MNKVACIIGSGGIGKTVAQKMTKEGWRVYATYYDKKPKIPGINILQADVTSIDSVAKAVSQIILTEKKVDAVVFSVSAPIENKPLISLQWDDYSKHMDVQMKGLFNVVDALKKQVKQKNKIKFIILLTEYCLGKPPASLSHYITAKYALMGMAKSMAVELAKYNCTVNMVSPGMTSTDLIANLPQKLIEITAAANPLKRIATPEDVANVVVFLATDEANYINGANILVNGGGTME